MFDFLSPKDGPVVEGYENLEVVYAKDQPQYIPLRVLRSTDENCRVLSRWTLTDEQRKKVADGQDIYLELSTFGHALQPIRLMVGNGEIEEGEEWSFPLAPPSTSVICGCDGDGLSDLSVKDKAKDPVFSVVFGRFQDGESITPGGEASIDGNRLLDGWYFWDEAWMHEHGPFGTKEECQVAMRAYCDSL